MHGMSLLEYLYIYTNLQTGRVHMYIQFHSRECDLWEGHEDHDVQYGGVRIKHAYTTIQAWTNVVGSEASLS